MNKYVRAIAHASFGNIKMVFTKAFHPKTFVGTPICFISPHSEITMDKSAMLSVGHGLKMRDGAKIRVRKKAQCIIGRNCFINSNSSITCHEKIVIGDDVQISPNVLLYDHDHDFRIYGGIKEGQYKTAPIIIGNGVWIGANSIILRGTSIGDNSVIGAGSVVKGSIPANSVFIQKRDSIVSPISEK